MRRSIYILGLVVLLIPGTIAARTWYITPDGTGDVPTIQAGIDSAAAGDEVVLANGVFTGDGNRDLNYRTKALTLRSVSGNPELCIIDCQGSPGDQHRGVGFGSGTGAGSVLEGVTIRGGYWESGGGGGIACYDASPTITNVILQENYADEGGGGLECFHHSSPAISNVMFLSNSSAWYTFGGGGGMSCQYWSEPAVVGCVFEDNYSLGCGGGVFCQQASPSFVNCTIVNNRARFEGGGVGLVNSPANFTNVTLFGNTASQGTGVFADANQLGWITTLENVIIAGGVGGFGAVSVKHYSEIALSCCNIYGNDGGDWTDRIADQYGVNGNFSACPSFCHAEAGNFHLCDYSPCAPGNHPDGYDCGLIGAWDVGCSCGPTRAQPTTWGTIKAMYR